MHLTKNHRRMRFNCFIVAAIVKYLYFITPQTDK